MKNDGIVFWSGCALFAVFSLIVCVRSPFGLSSCPMLHWGTSSDIARRDARESLQTPALCD